jgi:hypothetical protein
LRDLRECVDRVVLNLAAGKADVQFRAVRAGRVVDAPLVLVETGKDDGCDLPAGRP